MLYINRDVVIIKPRKPFIDWANAVDPYDGPKVNIEDFRKDCTVFLVPELDTIPDAIDIIENNFETIFENELEGMYTDESLWPKTRTLDMFREWFDVEYHSMVFDTIDGPIEKVDDNAV